MTSVTFRTIFRQFHSSRELFTGLAKFSPAAAHAGHHTCRTTGDVRKAFLVRPASVPSFLTSSQSLLTRYQIYHASSSNKTPQSAVNTVDLDDSPDFVPILNENSKDISEKINSSVMQGNVGRLFAVIHIGSHQRKVTTEDIVLVEGDFMADVGDRIRLEKILLVGNKDFTMTGTPVLSRDLVRVEATVIEKTLSHIRFNFKYIRRKRFRKFKLKKFRYTVLVINSINVNPAALTPNQNAEEKGLENQTE